MGLFDDLLTAEAPAQPPPSALNPGHRDLAIRTIYGEAANEPDQGQAAVAAVIRNRVEAGRYGGKDIPGVVLARNQFEPWGNPEARARMSALKPDDPRYQKIGGIVDQVFGGQMPDPTNGATYFFSPTAQAALGRNVPSWAQGEGQPIGRHTFYAPEGRVNIAQAPTDVSAQRRTTGLFDDFLASSPSSSGQDSAAGVGSAPPPLPADTGGRFSDTAGENFRTAREGQSPTVATKGEAAQKGFFRGVTFNFIDELNAVARAGGLDPKDADGGRALEALIKGAYKLYGGDEDAANTYRVEASKERADAARIQEQQPGASIAGELGGAVATLPFGGFAAKGAGLGARAAAGAKTGAVYGALSGAGEGTDLQSRATGAATSGATGAAIGAAAAPLVEGVVQAGRTVGAPIANMVRGIRNPDDEAARRVTGALQRDITSTGGAPGLTPAEFSASRAAGGPATIMDIGGETTRGLARSAANTSPEARAGLNRAVNDRFESQSERVTGWLNQTFGPADTGATREALQDAARRANRPAYAQAYREGDQPLWSPEMQRLVGSPDVVDAMKTAAEKGKSRAITDGFGGFNSSVQISPTGVVEFTKGKNGQPTYPNLQFWDYTKRALDDAANAARRTGRNDEASVLGQLATTLRNELDTMVPSYQGARAGAARFFGAGDALEAGGKFLTSNAPLADARRAFSAMSPPERQLFREGFVQSLTQKIESTGDRRNVLNSIAQSPRAQQQIELAMGPQRAREFEAMMRVEGVMDLARGAVQGNSTTARQLTELGLAGGAYGIGTGFDPFNPNAGALAGAALVYGAARGRGAIDQRVAQRVGEMLASNDPGVLRRGLQIVSRNQNMLNALRRFDQRAARVGIGQAPQPAVPALQSGAVGRADQEQQ